jgi:hypothetical protein
MFQRRTLSRLTAALFALAGIVGAGVVPTTQCIAPTAAAGQAECVRARTCCCRSAAEKPACCCRPDEKPPLPAPTVPDDAVSIVKWVVLWSDTPAVSVADVIPSRAAPSTCGSFCSTYSRSVQSLFCIWQT